MILSLKVVLSLLLLIAGGAKVAGARPLAEQFTEFGLPKSMMYLVGVLELCAAVGIHISSLTFFAAVGVVLLMLGAIGNHLKVRHAFKQTLPAVVTLGLAATLCALCWKNVFE